MIEGDRGADRDQRRNRLIGIDVRIDEAVPLDIPLRPKTCSHRWTASPGYDAVANREVIQIEAQLPTVLINQSEFAVFSVSLCIGGAPVGRTLDVVVDVISSKLRARRGDKR